VISVDVGDSVSGLSTKLYADFNSVVKRVRFIAKSIHISAAGGERRRGEPG